MSSHVQVREALEKANMAIQAIKDMVPAVATHDMALNQLAQVVYAMAQRLTAMEIRQTKLLEHNGMLNESLTPQPVADAAESVNEQL